MLDFLAPEIFSLRDIVIIICTVKKNKVYVKKYKKLLIRDILFLYQEGINKYVKSDCRQNIGRHVKQYKKTKIGRKFISLYRQQNR